MSLPDDAPQTFAPTSKVKALFTFRPHPFVERDGLIVPDDQALMGFWALMYRRFGSDPVPVYRICEIFDIHRCVAAEWLNALVRHQGVVKPTTSGLVFSATSQKPGITNLKPAAAYDPWRDREHDRFMGSYYSAFPWFIIDKYYRIAVDEVLCFTGEIRIRPDGRPFAPITAPYGGYEDPFAVFRNPNGWSRADWPQDAYNALCTSAALKEADPGQPKIKRRLTGPLEERRRREAEDASRAAAQIEARIDRLAIRGHKWLEDFIRRSPNTPDHWITAALADENSRREADKRWKAICASDPRLADFLPKPQVRPLPQRLHRIVPGHSIEQSA